jgi:acyl transferase domain-containing protein
VTTRKTVAVVAVSCRFPGARPEAFWEVLSGGVDSPGEVPEDRYDIDSSDPDQTPGKRRSADSSTGEAFDPEFFGISRARRSGSAAAAADAETVWEGIERAGTRRPLCAAARPASSRVGANECAPAVLESIDKIGPYFITGNALAPFPVGLPSRWDSKGRRSPSTPHAARRWWPSIRPAGLCTPVLRHGIGRRCERLAESVTVIAASRARMLSPVGRCKTFAASADGYVRSEGCRILDLRGERRGARWRSGLRGNSSSAVSKTAHPVV